jgi:hypothetical protein
MTSTSSFGIELMRTVLTREFPNEDFNNHDRFISYAKNYFGVTVKLSQLNSQVAIEEDWERESNKQLYYGAEL